MTDSIKKILFARLNFRTPKRCSPDEATGRNGTALHNEVVFRDERDQQVVFLIDCGQSMRAQDGELCQFDHALNAVLLLANVA